LPKELTNCRSGIFVEKVAWRINKSDYKYFKFICLLGLNDIFEIKLKLEKWKNSQKLKK